MCNIYRNSISEFKIVDLIVFFEKIKSKKKNNK